MNDNSPDPHYAIQYGKIKCRPGMLREGWYVTYGGGRVSLAFETEARAERCRDVLIADDLRAAKW